METKVEVALVKRACPICAKSFNAEIVINKNITRKDAKKVKELDGKVVGYLESPCEDCKNYMKQGIIVIGINKDLTKDMANPYRTGHFTVVKEGVLERIFEDIDTSNRAVFLDTNLGKQIGLFKVN